MLLLLVDCLLLVSDLSRDKLSAKRGARANPLGMRHHV